MCGIAGVAGSIDHRTLETMVLCMKHRGPDDSGVWVSAADLDGWQVGLSNCRLAIIDLSPAGHQPMLGEAERSVITYNGEVYNHPELRAELEARGERFRSRTDTEVVLRLLDLNGPGCLRRLNGMFGLAYWDETRRELLLARDRYGIKPLYYAHLSDGGLVFASEIKAMLACRGVPRGIDLAAMDAYLRFLWVPGPNTLFSGIFKLPPGHFLRWRAGRVEIRPYWDIDYEVVAPVSEAALVEELQTVLKRAVQRHLISDVPVGLFLSGGLDSTSLLSMVHQITREPARAYTIAYRDEDAALEQAGQEDARHARAVARRMDADYCEILVRPDIADLLPEVVYHLDEPVADPAAISTLLISRAAREHVTVLLSGQGADEVFAGYRVHSAAHLARVAGNLPGWLRRGPLRAAIDALPAMPTEALGISIGRRLAAQRYLRQLLDVADLPPAEGYIAMRSYYAPAQQRRLYSPELRLATLGFDAARSHLNYFHSAPKADSLNRLLYTDLKTFLPELNLTYSDKLTAAASVEGRVPFLDNEVVEFAAKLPPNLKLRGLTGKYLLRQAMRGQVPDSVILRRKAGFGAPVRKWLRDELRPMVHDLLSVDVLRRRGYFEPSAVERLVHDNESGIADQPLRVWALLTLEVWHRIFLDSRLPVDQAANRC
jgi:asparagine synthase (glutamine-hydrolysing)